MAALNGHTPVARLLLEVKHAVQRDPDGKVVVFSAWSKLLKLVENALNDHRSFKVVSLVGNKKEQDQVLIDFRKPISEGGARVLCVGVGAGSGGAGQAGGARAAAYRAHRLRGGGCGAAGRGGEGGEGGVVATPSR